MKNPAQLAFNAVLLIAVAVLYFLHFNSRPATKPVAAAPAATEAPAALADTATPASSAPVADTAPETADSAPAVASVAPASGTIVYVESSKMLDGYQGMKDARHAFEAKAKGWESQNQALVSGFQTAVQQYQKTAASLTAEQRAAAEQKLQQQQQEGAVAQQRIQAQAQEAEAKLTQTVLESVNKKVEAYGKAHGYKMILVASPSGTIAYGEKNLNVTAPVIAYLNSEYHKK